MRCTLASMPWVIRLILLLIALVAGTGRLATGQAPQAPQASAGVSRLWQGAYSPAQAVRGEMVYSEHCSTCHGSDMTGNSAALIGQQFWDRWGEDSLGSLFEVIRTTMPIDEPGSLAEQNYVDLIAYLLKVNGVPAGPAELKSKDIPAIRLEGKDGPGVVPNYSLISVNGCLTEDPAGRWVLTKATEPVKTRNPDAEKTALPEAPLGNATYVLLSAYPSPAPHVGRKMQGKGLLIRTATELSLNVTSLRVLGPTCP